MVFLLIKLFAKVTYQRITVTQLSLQPSPFSSFVVPVPGMGVIYMKMKNNHIILKTFTVNNQLG